MEHSQKQLPELDALDKERQYLEGLFYSRLNFYFVFAPIVLGALYSKERWFGPTERTLGLLIATLISGLITLSVLRTHLLIEVLLRELRRTGKPNGYQWASAEVTKLGILRKLPIMKTTSNTFLVCVPCCVTLIFLILLLASSLQR
jgi:hypothetical protein